MSETPDVHDPEFRNLLYNMMLERLEHLNKSDALVKMLLDERTPGALARAPELWEQVREAAKSQQTINEYLRATFEAAGDLMENKVAIDAIGVFTGEQLKKQRDGDARGT